MKVLAEQITEQFKCKLQKVETQMSFRLRWQQEDQVCDVWLADETSHRKSSYYKSIIEALKHFNSYLKSEKNKNECKVTKQSKLC